MFENKISTKLSSKCKFIKNLDIKKKINVLGLPKEKIKASLNREYSIPLLFEGSKSDKTELFKSVNEIGLSLQEGGRVINLCDKVLSLIHI